MAEALVPVTLSLALCSLKMDRGTVCPQNTGYQQRYFFDTKSNHCRDFYYLGCGGNRNKFLTLDECTRRCYKVEKNENELTRGLYSRLDYPSAYTDVCQLENAGGPCQDWQVTWYYNTAKQQCDRFWYGGCEGNGNRFKTQEECEARCLPQSEYN